MKNIIVILVAGVLILLGACDQSDFLDRYPKATPNPENFFVDATSARLAVNACYDDWCWPNDNMLFKEMTIMLDAMTDDSYRRVNAAIHVAMEQWDFTPTNGVISAWWTYPYRSINAANFAIEHIPTSSDLSFTSEQQAPYIAEAKFMRAYSYLWLTMFYGDLPLLTTTASDFDEFNTPRSPQADVFKQIVEDFTYAKDYLPETQTLKGTPVKAAAGAYLAKTYLIMNDWAKAEAAAREAIQVAENSGHKLMDDYLSIWSDEGNPELLFYWSFVEDDPKYGQNMTVQRLCRDLPVPLRIAINGDGWGYAVPQRDLYDAFESGDPRREFTLYSPGYPYEIYPGTNDVPYKHEKYNEAGKKVTWNVVYKTGDMVEYDYRWSLTGLNVRKMTNPVKDLADVRRDGMDIPAMRMAELYLILAEALAEQGKAEALTWVNKVRSRASVNMPPKTTADGNLIDIVRHERRVELAMEGLRIFDLIRWKTIAEVFGNGKKVKRNFYSDYLPESSSMKYDSPVGDLTRYPIFPLPQSEIDQNSAINTNNPGW